VGFDANHTIAIKRAPGAFAVFLGHAKIPAADDGGILCGMASAFDFAGVARVELKGAEGAVSFDEAHGDDAAASREDELADGFGFVHGEEEGVRLSPRCNHDCAFSCPCLPFEPLALLIVIALSLL